MIKPSADECLDVLTQLWTREAVPSGMQELLVQLDQEIPGWHLKALKEINEADQDAVKKTYRIMWWRKCRELLKAAGRIWP